MNRIEYSQIYSYIWHSISSFLIQNKVNTYSFVKKPKKIINFVINQLLHTRKSIYIYMLNKEEKITICPFVDTIVDNIWILIIRTRVDKSN